MLGMKSPKLHYKILQCASSVTTKDLAPAGPEHFETWSEEAMGLTYMAVIKREVYPTPLCTIVLAVGATSGPPFNER